MQMQTRLFLSGVGIVLGLLLALAGLGMMSTPAGAQAFATNTPVRPAVQMMAPTQFAPSATAAAFTLTARAAWTAQAATPTPSYTPSLSPTPMPTDTPAPPIRVNEVIERDRVLICLLCVVVD